MKQIVIDIETTGLEVTSGHRIIEIAAIVLHNRQITQNIFHYYINPERAVDEKAYAIHKLSNEFLKDKPIFTEVAGSFLKFITNADALIIHNAAFDIGFLNHELSTLDPKHKPLEECYKIIDTLKLARKQRPNQRNNLDALCEYYLEGYQKDIHRKQHGALLDTQLLAQVYLELTRKQTSFFDHMTGEQTIQNTGHNITTATPLNLHIQYANDLEVQAHQAQLNLINQTTGHCIWQE